MALSPPNGTRKSASQTRRALTPFQKNAQRVFVSLNRLVAKYRTKRAEWVFEILTAQGVRVVLDVGTAAGQFWKLILDRMDHLRVIGLDIHPPPAFPYGRFVAGSGLRMPFRDQSFDCVICNSVIEHVGGPEAQQALADEIRRVARRLYIVQVPAKHFPVEPHFLLPFVQYLPQHLKRSLHRVLYGFDPGDIHLPDKKSLRKLFPEERIRTEKFFVFTKSFVVVGTPSETLPPGPPPEPPTATKGVAGTAKGWPANAK